MRMFSLARLQTRIFLLVILAVLPALALIFYNNLEQRQLAALQVQEDALRLAQLAAAEQVQLIQGAHQLLLALAQLPAVRNGDAMACTELFTSLLKRHPTYDNLGAAHANGDVFCSVVPFTQPLSVAHATWFQRAAQTHRFTIGEYQKSQVTNEFVLVLGYPVLGPADQFQGTVAVSLNLSRLNQLATQARLPHGATLSAVDRNGVIVARYPDPQHWLGTVLPETPILQAMLAQREGAVEAQSRDGVARLYAFSEVREAGDVGLYVSIGIPTQVAFAQVHRRLVRNLLTLGIITLLMLAAAWIGSSWLVLRPVHVLLQATKQLRAGDLSVRTGLPQGLGELDQLVIAFDDMAEALEHRETERKRAEEALQILSRQLLEAQENERRHLARELHDEIGQALTALKINLQTAQRTPDASPTYVADSIGIVDRTLQQVRNLSLDLRPALLDDLGLVAALRWYVDRQAQRTGFTAQFVAEPLDPRPHPDIETACFRVAQEALTNVMRYAQAQHVRVELRQRNAELQLLVQDDGRGFDVQAARERAARGGSTGLPGMQERVWLVGGQLDITSAPASGTAVRVRFPLQQRQSPLAIGLPAEETQEETKAVC